MLFRSVGALEIVDELLEILDRVDVVVRRRGDESHAGGRVALREEESTTSAIASASLTKDGIITHRSGNTLADLVARELSSLSRLGSLSHLDLELVGVGEVVGGDSESTGRDLLDGGSHRISVRQDVGSLSVLSSLSGVGLSSQSVHRDRDRRVSLHRNGSVRHGSGHESSDDLVPWLDLLDRDRRPVRVVKLEQPSERDRLDLLVRILRVRVV